MYHPKVQCIALIFSSSMQRLSKVLLWAGNEIVHSLRAIQGPIYMLRSNKDLTAPRIVVLFTPSNGL